MEDIFKELQEAGNNCVEHLVEWIRQSNIIGKTQEAEDKAMKLFEEVNDRQNVELEKFVEVMEKIAEQERKSLEQISDMLAETVPKIPAALANAAAAFEETMSKK